MYILCTHTHTHNLSHTHTHSEGCFHENEFNLMAHTLRLFEATQAHVFASSFSHTQGALTARVLCVCVREVCVCVNVRTCVISLNLRPLCCPPLFLICQTVAQIQRTRVPIDLHMLTAFHISNSHFSCTPSLPAAPTDSLTHILHTHNGHSGEKTSRPWQWL